MSKVYYNTDTGEVFDALEDAVQDAREQYDYGDPTNAATWADMPYIELEERQWNMLVEKFGRSAA